MCTTGGINSTPTRFVNITEFKTRRRDVGRSERHPHAGPESHRIQGGLHFVYFVGLLAPIEHRSTAKRSIRRLLGSKSEQKLAVGF